MAEPQFQRRTRQREVILEELRKVKSHPTAVGLYELVRHRLPKISLGTVYRNLEQLCGSGEVCRLPADGAEARFDADTQPHDHVRCVRCGRLADLPGTPTTLTLETLDETAGFEIIGYRLEYLGLCAACRKPDNPVP